MFDNLKSSYAAGILSGEIPTKKIHLSVSPEKAAKALDRIKAKEIRKKFAELDRIALAPDVRDIEISITYKKNRTWGWNPHAELFVNGTLAAKDYASGCGYDKTSAAMAYALNKSDSVMKMLYQVKDASPGKSNEDLFGYGTGCWLFPYFDAGCGVSTIERIFERLGFAVDYRQYGECAIFRAVRNGGEK